MSKLVENLLSKTSLENRLQVNTEIAMINLIHNMGYRENSFWTEDEDDKLDILLNAAQALTKENMELIKNWKNKDNEDSL